MCWNGPEAIAPYVQRICLIPKVNGGIARLPRQIDGKPVILGFSVPTSFGGTTVPLVEFQGWQVHLLGGSPKAQYDHYERMTSIGAEVTSADGNMISKMCIRYRRYWNGDEWIKMPDQDPRAYSDAQYDNRYHYFKVSCENILEGWNALLSKPHTRKATPVMTNVINQTQGDQFALYHADCVEGMRGVPDNSVDYHIFSPPFASLYTYSNSERDMGNVLTHSDFFAQYRYLVAEQFRTTKPGRLLSAHCMLLPTTKTRDGYIGLTDFRGELIRIYQDAGFIFHSEVCIWKDPVTAMQRTKALGLLYKQLKKDSARSRQGIPDYLVTFQKPGDNPDPVTKDPDEYTVDEWQQVASPVWNYGENDPPVKQFLDWIMGFFRHPDTLPIWQRYQEPVWYDINPSDTLQYRSAREYNDEKHICPLQLQVIERAIRLWTNPGDVVCSPFAGIGSELVTALEMGRRAIGFELKKSYYDQAARNCRVAEQKAHQPTLFDYLGAA